jgi:hypothetical protein
MATRPTIDELRGRVGLPTAGPPRNATELCGTCADYGPDEVEYAGGRTFGLCRISRPRMDLYPMLRSVGVAPTAVMPCWRSRP